MSEEERYYQLIGESLVQASKAREWCHQNGFPLLAEGNWADYCSVMGYAYVPYSKSYH